MKRYLMTPGPTPIPPEVSLALAKPIIHHRTDEFKKLFDETLQMLKTVMQTENDVVIFSSSGSGAMEAAVSNLIDENQKAITINAGKFGERWTKLVKAFGGIPIELKYEYGDHAKSEDIQKAIEKNPDVKAVYIQASETSTATAHPIEEIGLMLKEKYPDIVFVVDGITAYGAIDVKTDKWNIDLGITGSQKALMLPPGLSIISVSEKAKITIKQNSNKYHYFDILGEIGAYGKFTPPVGLIFGLKESLTIILNEGLKNVFKRHSLLARATRESVKTIGLKLLSKRPVDSLTAIVMPEKINSSDVITQMESLGVEVSNGQGHLKGKIIRIAHLGYFFKPDIIVGISAMEMALKRLGFEFDFGHATKKAMEIFADE